MNVALSYVNIYLQIICEYFFFKSEITEYFDGFKI
jgi:hypothetical protein